MSFKEWYDNADMPTQDENGNWYDAEDGSSYKDTREIKNKKIEKLSDEATISKNAVKILGGKPLRGTLRQRNWAEVIRYEKLLNLDDDHVAYFLQDKFNRCKFWIENRDAKLDQWVQHVLLINELINKKAKTRLSSECDKIRAQIKEQEQKTGIKMNA